jgi:UDP-glucose 4-epimerase
MKLLVVGRGLLGQSLIRLHGLEDLTPMTAIQWSDPTVCRRQLEQLGTTFGRSIDGPWRVAWCAGAGVVATSDAQFVDEQSYLESFLESVQRSAPSENGGLFFASSAGAVFGLGSSHWLTEASPHSPISPYGRSKLAQEQMVGDWSRVVGIPTLIGRLSNLYGPGQNLSKPQGFISQLIRSILEKRSFRLGVSADTERDFIHVDDAAARILAWLSRPLDSEAAVKLIAAGQSTTLGRVANVVHSVTHIQPKILYASIAGSSLQPRHLRFASRVRPELDVEFSCRPLEVGVLQTWQAMLRVYVRCAFPAA